VGVLGFDLCSDHADLRSLLTSDLCLIMHTATKISLSATKEVKARLHSDVEVLHEKGKLNHVTFIFLFGLSTEKVYSLTEINKVKKICDI